MGRQTKGSESALKVQLDKSCDLLKNETQRLVGREFSASIYLPCVINGSSQRIRCLLRCDRFGCPRLPKRSPWRRIFKCGGRYARTSAKIRLRYSLGNSTYSLCEALGGLDVKGLQYRLPLGDCLPNGRRGFPRARLGRRDWDGICTFERIRSVQSDRREYLSRILPAQTSRQGDCISHLDRARWGTAQNPATPRAVGPPHNESVDDSRLQ